MRSSTDQTSTLDTPSSQEPSMATTLRLTTMMFLSPPTKLITKSTTERRKNIGTELRFRSSQDPTLRPNTETSQRPGTPTSTPSSTEPMRRPGTTLFSTQTTELSTRLSTEPRRRPGITLSTQLNTET